MAFEDRSTPSSANSSPIRQNPEIDPSKLLHQDGRQKIKVEPDGENINEPTKPKYSSYSIERFVQTNDKILNSDYTSKEQLKSNTVSNEPGVQNNTGWIKFSVDNILKPDFGTKCDPFKRIVTPIIRKNDELRKPRLSLNRRSFDNPRLNSSDGFPKRRHSDEPIESAKEVTAKIFSDGESSSPVKTDLWPAWVYCTRYSDRPSSGPRSRRVKRKEKKSEEKRPRTAFSGDQLSRLKREFNENRYLTERRRQDLARELNLNEAQIKIWFQNKRAKIKKSKSEKNPLALQLMAQGLYNHSTVPVDEEEFLEDMVLANQNNS